MDYFSANPTRSSYTIVDEEKNNFVQSTLSDKEKTKLKRMIDIVCKEYPGEEKDIYTLVRYLKSKKFKVKAAYKSYQKRMEWINRYKPHEISIEECLQQAGKGKGFWYGRDKKGRPILYMRAVNHIKNASPTETEDTYRFFTLLLETGRHMLLPPPNDQIVVIYDRKGYTNANTDMKLFKMLVGFADFYPEIIDVVLFANCGFVFHLMYTLAKTFVDPVTLSKFRVLHSNAEKMTKEISEVIELDNLVADLGGNALYKEWFPKETPEDAVKYGKFTNSMSVSSSLSSMSQEDILLNDMKNEGLDVLADSQIELD